MAIATLVVTGVLLALTAAAKLRAAAVQAKASAGLPRPARASARDLRR